MAVSWRLFMTLMLMDYYSTAAKVDMKYDFTFDGKQGFWREKQDLEVRPPMDYINTTIDGDCVVQCGRKAIWDIYENFTKFQLWTQDNVLVDFHLTTFNGSTDKQQTLIVKGFTFTKTTKKSLFRFLPLALDQFSKIASLESRVSLYVDSDFNKHRITATCEMTEQCMDHVHKGSAVELTPNRTEVPYTSGITRTFENTLMSALIILRDVSPTLSVWEAFSAQTLTTKEDWFDLTCSGHDPGEDRPGVPYEISRCCFFHLGNVLLDEEVTDQWAINMLSQLKRTVECKTQIGDIYMLREAVIVVTFIMLVLFVPQFIRYFLSKPIPYRPLVPEQSIYPCDPADVPRQAEIDLEQLDNGSVLGDTKRKSVQEKTCRSTEEEDMDLILGDGHNYNHTDVRRRVYIDSDPEFHLNIHLILSYLFLCTIENRFLIVIRRILIIYGVWLLIGLACWVYGTYYPILLDEPVMQLQADITAEIITFIFGMERTAITEFYYHIFILPAIALAGTFGTNALLLLRKQSVAKSLYSTGEITFFGSKFPEVLQASLEMKRVPKTSRYKSYELLVWQNMQARMINVFKHDFWRLWWREWVIGKSPKNCCLRGCFLLFWLPFSLLLVMFHVLPFFSLWDNCIREQLKYCFMGKDVKGNNVHCCKRLPRLFVMLLQMAGIFFVYAMAWDFLLLYNQMLMFVIIDIIRNASQHIPSIILVAAILAYIKQAFWNFSDKYRELKMGTIQGLRDLHWEYREEYYHYNKRIHFVFKTPPHEVMWDFSDYGEISISRRFFYEVVRAHRPYKYFVIRMFLKLGITITVITLLVLLIIDFQVFDQFSGAGQTILTLFTVSLPLLLGGVRSTWQRDLSIRRRHLTIRAWAERICRIVTVDKYPPGCGLEPPENEKDRPDPGAFNEMIGVPRYSNERINLSRNVSQRSQTKSTTTSCDQASCL